MISLSFLCDNFYDNKIKKSKCLEVEVLTSFKEVKNLEESKKIKPR